MTNEKIKEFQEGFYYWTAGERLDSFLEYKVIHDILIEKLGFDSSIFYLSHCDRDHIQLFNREDHNSNVEIVLFFEDFVRVFFKVSDYDNDKNKLLERECNQDDKISKMDNYLNSFSIISQNVVFSINKVKKEDHFHIQNKKLKKANQYESQQTWEEFESDFCSIKTKEINIDFNPIDIFYLIDAVKLRSRRTPTKGLYLLANTFLSFNLILHPDDIQFICNTNNEIMKDYYNSSFSTDKKDHSILKIMDFDDSGKLTKESKDLIQLNFSF